MEQFLSTIFPCCFPNRHSRSRDAPGSGLLNERTPLLGHDSSSLGAASGHDSDSAAASGSDTTRAKRKPNSVLPSPAYDAHALKAIIDDFKAHLISVDATEKKTSLLIGGVDELKQDEAERAEESGESGKSSPRGGTKHVTPVHSLRISVSNSNSATQTTSGSTLPKLVDIWTESSGGEAAGSSTSSSVGAGSGAILSYSAAVQRGKKSAGRSKGRFGAPKPLSTASGAGKDRDEGAAEVEQRTYESLNEIVQSKPLVHDWDLDDACEAGHGEG